MESDTIKILTITKENMNDILHTKIIKNKNTIIHFLKNENKKIKNDFFLKFLRKFT